MSKRKFENESLYPLPTHSATTAVTTTATAATTTIKMNHQFPWYQFQKVLQLYFKENHSDRGKLELEIRFGQYHNNNTFSSSSTTPNQTSKCLKEPMAQDFRFEHFDQERFLHICDIVLGAKSHSNLQTKISEWIPYKSTMQGDYRLLEYPNLKRPLFEEKKRNLYLQDFILQPNPNNKNNGFVLRTSISLEKFHTKPLKNPESISFIKRKTIRYDSIYSDCAYEISFSVIWRGESKLQTLQSKPEHQIEIEFKPCTNLVYEQWYIEKGSQFQIETTFLMSLIMDGLSDSIQEKDYNKTNYDISLQDWLYDTECFKSYSDHSFKEWLGNSFCQRFYEMSIIKMDIINHLQKMFLKYSSNILLNENQRFRFPGTLASNIVLDDLEYLKLSRDKYKIFWKTDGTRGLILFTKWKSNHLAIFINRALDFYSIPIQTLGTELYENTILDGELIQNNNQEFDFQVFDCLWSQNNCLLDKKYIQRIEHFSDFILPKIKSCNCFQIVKKNFIQKRNEINTNPNDDPSTTKTATINYKTDGLILLDIDAPYICGQNRFLFKWKLASDNTVDFSVKLNEKDLKNPCIELYLWHKNLQLFESYKIEKLEELKSEWLNWIYVLKIHDNVIIECKLDSINNIWIPIKLRIDKDIPNNTQVYNYSVLALKENIQQQTLIDILFSG